MSDTLAGDPFHEGASQPMMSLKGGQSGVNTQQPMESQNVENPRGQNVSEWTGWSTTTIGSGSRGGDTPNAGHDTNGHRSGPAQSSTSA